MIAPDGPTTAGIVEPPLAGKLIVAPSTALFEPLPSFDGPKPLPAPETGPEEPGPEPDSTPEFSEPTI